MLKWYIGGPGWASSASTTVPANPPGLTLPIDSARNEARTDENFYTLLDTKNGTVPVGPDMWEDPQDNEDEDGPWGTRVVTPSNDDAPAWKEEVNLWDGHDGPKGKADAIEQLVCPTHGVVCRRGICADYSRLKKQLEKEKQAKEKEKEKENTRQNWRARGGKSRGNARDESSMSNLNSVVKFDTLTVIFGHLFCRRK